MERTVYEVTPSGAKWVLSRRGSDTQQVFATRKEAVTSGREACRANRPSRLRVRKDPSSSKD